jgi:regulator of replication initiation timing
MSQIDIEGNVLSETRAGQDDVDDSKLVPVAESIRYRKRAQSAEKKVETLSEQLAQAKSQIGGMVEELGSIQVEQELMRKLVAAGTVDLEAAVLIAKARVKDETETDLDSVIEQLKKEKQYLFGNDKETTATVKRTAGAKDRVTGNQAILERAAKKAAATGNRTDLQEYLKLRRNFV